MWFCHNKKHKICKKKKLICKKCDVIQNPSLKCKRCLISFGKYYCKHCNYLSNYKGNYHCEECNKFDKLPFKNFIKCNNCNLIIIKNNDIITNKLIKFKYNKFKLKCNHNIYISSFKQYKLNNYKCPKCNE